MYDTDLDRITAKFNAVTHKDVDGKLVNMDLVSLSMGNFTRNGKGWHILESIKKKDFY